MPLFKLVLPATPSEGCCTQLVSYTLSLSFYAARKLKADAAKAQRDADHQRLLAYTVSKSFALTISENEQLRDTARAAQHSAQVAQQQSRHDQAEVHRLRKEVEQALQQKACAEPAPSIAHSRQLSGHVLPEAQRVQQTSATCMLQATEAARHPLQHRDVATQSEACFTKLSLDKQHAASHSEEEPIGVVQPEANDRDVHGALSLQFEVTPLQVQLNAVRSELFAIQQAAQQDQHCEHASVSVQRMLQQTEAILQSMSELHQEMEKAVFSCSGTTQPAISVSESMQVDLEHADRGALHKRQRFDDCESSGKRHRIQSNAVA